MTKTGSGDRGHGRRLSDEEHDRRVVALYQGQPEAPSRRQQEWLRRQELELAIDHRLGCEFPRARREALWAIQQRVERRRVGLIFRHWLRRLLPGSLARGAQGLARALVEEYARVLDPDELESFFGEVEAHDPALPIDPGAD